MRGFFIGGKYYPRLAAGILQCITLVHFVGLVVLLEVDLEVTEIAGLLNLLKVDLGVLLEEVLLGTGQMVGKLELLLLGVKH